MTENLLTPEQLSEFLPDHPTTGTISVWKCQGRIPFVKHGRKVFYNKVEIEKWMANDRPETTK